MILIFPVIFLKGEGHFCSNTKTRLRLVVVKGPRVNGEFCLCRRVNLVVTETFDAGLLGEHVLSTLQHAWQDLLFDNTKLSEAKVGDLCATSWKTRKFFVLKTKKKLCVRACGRLVSFSVKGNSKQCDCVCVRH